MNNKINFGEQDFCICGHLRNQHKLLNANFWTKFNEKLKEYSDTPESREKFYFDLLSDSSMDDWQCSNCICQLFKIDALKYLEKKHHAKTN